jgi:hypothetical protein
MDKRIVSFLLAESLVVFTTNTNIDTCVLRFSDQRTDHNNILIIDKSKSVSQWHFCGNNVPIGIWKAGCDWHDNLNKNPVYIMTKQNSFSPIDTNLAQTFQVFRDMKMVSQTRV